MYLCDFELQVLLMNTEALLLKKGNQTVFRQIVNTYWGRLNKFAQIYTCNEEAAKELVQDTFLSLWENRAKLDDDTKFVPYLMVILRNKCLNYLKQTKVEMMPIHDLSNEMIYQRANIYAIENEASALLEVEDLHKMINKAINTLPDKTREIFELSRTKGLSNKEIAAQLNKSVKTVEFHITKTLQHIKKHLPKDYFILFVFLYIH